MPLHRQDPVSLEITEGPVVGDQLEAIVGPLERSSGTMATVRTLADVRPDDGDLVVMAKCADPTDRLGLRHGRACEADGGDDLVLALGIEVDEPHLSLVEVDRLG